MRKLFKYPIALPLFLVGLAALLRTILAVLGWPVTNSDESIMNLMALHIAYRGEHSTFFYGQHYLSPFEAYVGAVLFRIFEPSVLVMRLEMIGLSVTFLTSLYVLVKRLYTRKFALVVLAFLALGSPMVFRRQMEAVGWPELPLFLALLFLLAYGLTCNGSHWSWTRRAMAYGAWGIFAGLALYGHAVTAPYVLASFSLLILWRPHEVLRMGLWSILAGFVIGTFPLLWYNLHAVPGRNDSLTIALHMTEQGQGTVYDIWTHLWNTLLVSVPTATGFSSQCLSQGISGGYPFLPTFHLHCVAEQAAWGLSCITLLLIAGIMAVTGIWQRKETMKQSVRLLLLLASVLTIVLYIRGGAPVGDPINASRYLTCMWISIPAILWPLWQIRSRIVSIGVLVLLFLALLHSTVTAFNEVQNAQETTTKTSALVAYLEKHHITRFYSEYWTCNRLIFASQEKLICGDTWNVNGKLVHGTDRYSAYRRVVEISKDPAFVYPARDNRVTSVQQELKAEGIVYETKEVAGYAVIVPKGSILS